MNNVRRGMKHFGISDLFRDFVLNLDIPVYVTLINSFIMQDRFLYSIVLLIDLKLVL